MYGPIATDFFPGGIFARTAQVEIDNPSPYSTVILHKGEKGNEQIEIVRLENCAHYLHNSFLMLHSDMISNWCKVLVGVS
jgi:hypothetical protein